MKVALYARYSTDLQDKTSITGQFHNCEDIARQNDFEVVTRFQDEGISGTDESRPGYRSLLAAAERKEFDGIIVDETSRLTRNPWELPRLIEDFAFREQFLIAKGFDSRLETAQLLAGIYGGIDRMELQKIKQRTHRGLRERHINGFSAGGKTYGYTSSPIDASDPQTRWIKVINKDESKWVRWIFERYADGWGAKKIAGELNRLNVPSPGASWKRTRRRMDGKWQHSAILGMASRGSGILRNELYIGRVIWNRSEWIKRPGTSTRTYRLRPKDQWIIEEHTDLRIVSEHLWSRVKDRLANARSGGTKRGRKGTYLMTGILKCFDCGGSLTMIDQRCYGCGTRNRGGDSACNNPIRIRREHLEDRFLGEVREQLLADKTIRWAEKEIRKQLTSPTDHSGRIRKQLGEVECDLNRVVDAISKLPLSPALEAKLTKLEDDQRVLQAQLKDAECTIQLPDTLDIADRWRTVVEDLGNLPKRATPQETEAVRKSLYRIFGEVRVDRDGKGYAELGLGLPTKVVAGGCFGTLQVVFDLAA